MLTLSVYSPQIYHSMDRNPVRHIPVSHDVYGWFSRQGLVDYWDLDCIN